MDFLSIAANTAGVASSAAERPRMVVLAGRRWGGKNVVVGAH